MMTRQHLGIIIFDDIEVLDFCGPFEVFSVTRLNEDLRREQVSPFEISLIAQYDKTIVTTGGMKVTPDVTFENCPPLNILVVPGGWGTRREMYNNVLLDFVRQQAANVETLASVCTGALILGSAGLLNGLRATTHWRSLEMMQQLFPQVTVDSTSHVVSQGKVITSAGISAGIEMALQIVAQVYGEHTARLTARHMEYSYPENNRRRVVL
jgi:transcriptional regulator GlxA family with amidase domain